MSQILPESTRHDPGPVDIHFIHYWGTTFQHHFMELRIKFFDIPRRVRGQIGSRRLLNGYNKNNFGFTLTLSELIYNDSPDLWLPLVGREFESRAHVTFLWKLNITS